MPIGFALGFEGHGLDQVIRPDCIECNFLVQSHLQAGAQQVIRPNQRVQLNSVSFCKQLLSFSEIGYLIIYNSLKLSLKSKQVVHFHINIQKLEVYK
jgi:hypothetical protein